MAKAKKSKAKTAPIETPPIGRPTNYDPKYCQMLIDHMASGLSYESFAGVVEVSRQTIYDWEKVHTMFLDAKKVGAERNLLYWETAGQKGLWEEAEYNEQGKPIYKKSLNSTVWIFSMKNRHKWKDKQEIEVVEEDESAKLKKLSNAELTALVQGIIESRKEE